jgi:hypothetical protein
MNDHVLIRMGRLPLRLPASVRNNRHRSTRIIGVALIGSRMC